MNPGFLARAKPGKAIIDDVVAVVVEDEGTVRVGGEPLLPLLFQEIHQYLWKVNVQTRIIKSLRKLEENPRPPGIQKLKEEDAYRLRVGDYRVIYEIHDKVLLVLVVSVGHCREVYR